MSPIRSCSIRKESCINLAFDYFAKEAIRGQEQPGKERRRVEKGKRSLCEGTRLLAIIKFRVMVYVAFQAGNGFICRAFGKADQIITFTTAMKSCFSSIISNGFPLTKGPAFNRIQAGSSGEPSVEPAV